MPWRLPEMAEPPTPPTQADPVSAARGARDAAALLPFAALALFMPPIILIFATPARIAGVPLVICYIFGAWAAVILGALLIARKLATAEAGEGAPAERFTDLS